MINVGQPDDNVQWYIIYMIRKSDEYDKLWNNHDSIIVYIDGGRENIQYSTRGQMEGELEVR